MWRKRIAQVIDGMQARSEKLRDFLTDLQSPATENNSIASQPRNTSRSNISSVLGRVTELVADAKKQLISCGADLETLAVLHAQLMREMTPPS